MIYLLFFLFTKHLIVDFFLQTYWQAKNKGTFGHPGGLVHAGLHGLGISILLAFYWIPNFWAYALIDCISHYFIDWSKVNLTKKLGLSFKDAAYWWLLGIDQWLHTLVYLFIIYKLYGY
jgi:hypothetical protein